MAAMMLLWVVMAVAVRRWQRLLAVAVRRGVCLERTWGGQTRGALARVGLRVGRLMAPGSPCADTAEVLLDRNRRAIDARRLAAACTQRARAAWTRDRVYGQLCMQLYNHGKVRCGESTGSLGHVGRAPRLAEGALLSTRQPWAAVRGAPATIVVVVAWPLVVAAVEGCPARVRAVGVGGLLLVRGPLMWYLLVGGLRRRRRRRRLRCSPRAAGLGRVLPALLSSVLVALRVLGQILGLGGVRRLPKVVVVQRLLSGDPLRRVHRQQRRQQLLRLLG